MNRVNIKIPRGIQYISEWEDYNLPRGKHCIVDKGVTGCGYTEFCLRNNDWVILASPRKLLLENKSEQHLNDKNILYLINDIYENTDNKEEKIKELKEKIIEHHRKCIKMEKPAKFLITYDSLHYIFSTFEQLTKEGSYNFLNEYIVVIDEFQSIFIDSYFKAEVELDVVTELQRCKNVIYLSATPMLEKYLERLDEFKDLRYYYLDWSNSGYVEKIFINRKHIDSLTIECSKIINKYLNGIYPKTLDKNNKVIESKEAVFYFNSVKDIAKVLKKTKLTPKEAQILCSDTKDNRRKLRIKDENGKVIAKFVPNKVPLSSEPNPMFLFCTSSVYMGVDFYSDCASSYIFADPNIDCLALDISLDLPQIVGRQRNKNNPFKNNFTLYYKTRRKDNVRNLTFDEFMKIQDQRKKNSTNILEGFYALNEDQQALFIYKILADISISKYSRDFISVSKAKNGMPVWNNLVEIASERAWEVAQDTYQDEINVTKSIEDNDYITGEEKEKYELIVNDFLNNDFYKTNIFAKKLKSFCEFMDYYGGDDRIALLLSLKIGDPRFINYYRYFGTGRCSTYCFSETILRNHFISEESEDLLRAEIIMTFKESESYAKKYIKETLAMIYRKYNVQRIAKATDLNNYFSLVPVKVRQEDGTRAEGFKLLPKP